MMEFEMLDVSTHDIRDAVKAGLAARGLKVGNLQFTFSPTALPEGPGVHVWGMAFDVVAGPKTQKADTPRDAGVAYDVFGESTGPCPV